MTITNGGEDGGGEEDGLDEVPADGVVLLHHVDTRINTVWENSLVLTQQTRQCLEIRRIINITSFSVALSAPSNLVLIVFSIS